MDIRVAAEQARVAKRHIILNYLAKWENENGSLCAITPDEWMALMEPVANLAMLESPRQSLTALASLEAALAAQPEQQQGLVAASPAAAATQQSVTKEQALESLSEVGLWLSRDPHALRLRQFIEQASPAAAAGVPTDAKWHELKTDPDVFDAVVSGAKTHEIRYDDRDFQVGDGLLLRRTRDTGWAMKNTGAPLVYTGEECRRVVSHVLRGYGLEPGWVILSFAASPVAPVGAPTEEHSVHLASDETGRTSVAGGVNAPTAAVSGPLAAVTVGDSIASMFGGRSDVRVIGKVVSTTPAFFDVEFFGVPSAPNGIRLTFRRSTGRSVGMRSYKVATIVSDEGCP